MLPRFSKFKSVLALFTFLALTFFTIQATHAGQDEMALFFDELVPYGDWVDYKKYGPVWYPSKDVEEGWRPYLNGRWVPSAKGWVFETGEPWGWATYHFGNWMPTEEYGWVWVPGGTWYPSTATWRKSKEAIGWAPMPPPEYEPEPAFTPPGGFAPETPAQVQVVPAMYVFAPGAVFIQGMGQSYAPEYSYQNSGGLVPPEQLPEMLPMTEPVSNFTSEAANPEAVANWGPPLDQVSECTGVSPMALMNAVNVTNITMVQNCWPSPLILSRNPYFVHGRFFPDPWGHARMVSWHDGRGHGHWETHGNRRVFVDDWRGIRGHAINRSFPVKLPPGTGPKAPGWPPKVGKIKPPLTTAKLDRVLGLPGTATGKGSGMQKPGNLPAVSGGKLPLPGAVPLGAIRKGLTTAPAGSKGPIPVATDRRAQLDQERDRMEKEKSLIHKGQTEGGISAIKQHGKSTDTTGSSGKTTSTIRHHDGPLPLKNPSGSQVSSTPKTTGTSKIGQPGAGGQPPPTAEQLGKQREAQKQEQIKQLQQKQQASGIAPGGQGTPSGSAGPPSGGIGKGSVSPQASGGGVRPPKGYSGPPAGGPGSPAPGGFGIRSPKPGAGSGPGPVGGQPSVAGNQGGAMQAPKVQTQQVRPPTPPKSSGGGGKAPQQKKEEKKEEKKK